MQPKAPKPHFPLGVLIAFGVLIASSLLAVGWARWNGAAAVDQPMPAVVEARELLFQTATDGSIHVVTAKDGHELDLIPAGSDGFVSATLRGLNRERKRFGADLSGPFQLIRRADGSLTLNDPSTKIDVDLGAFGPTNVASFAAFMASSPIGDSSARLPAPGPAAQGRALPGSST